MNKYYNRGSSFEREVMKELKSIGCSVVLRSAGSHSLIDVVGVSSVFVYLVQCKFVDKPKNFNKEVYALLDLKDYLPSGCKVGLFVKVKSKGVERIWL